MNLADSLLCGPIIYSPPSCVSDPPSRYGFHLPSQTPDSSCHGSSALPMSCSMSTAPSSMPTFSMFWESSAMGPTSHGSSLAPVSRNGSMAPMLCGGSKAPFPERLGASISYTGSMVPSSCRPISPVPLRTSQITWQAHQSQAHTLSWIFSVHDLNAATISQLLEHLPPPMTVTQVKVWHWARQWPWQLYLSKHSILQFWDSWCRHWWVVTWWGWKGGRSSITHSRYTQITYLSGTQLTIMPLCLFNTVTHGFTLFSGMDADKARRIIQLMCENIWFKKCMAHCLPSR